MSNILNFIKEKSYILLIGTVVIIIFLVIITSCSGNKMSSYEGIESSMVSAAKSYYISKEDRLPKEDGETIKVSISTLIEAELLEEVIDPNNKEQTCNGYVEVIKVGKEYSYVPFLTCSGNYEPKYLTDLVKESKLDEYGNGVYNINGEYVYRGDDVKNYVKFNEQIWRIMRVNSNNEIKLILNDYLEDEYEWDTSFNVEEDEYVGVTTDYLNTNMRKVLLNFYNTNFQTDIKAHIVKKDWCIGALTIDENFNRDKECLKIKEQEYVGLMNISDYGAATLDVNCNNPEQEQCTNRNYLSIPNINTWTMNSVEGSTSEMYVFSIGILSSEEAYSMQKINPVIYLSSKVVAHGKGTLEEPFIVK